MSDSRNVPEGVLVRERTTARGTVRVIDSQGNGIDDALLSWTPAKVEWIAQTVSESGRPWFDIEAGSRFAHSTHDGHLLLDFDANQPAVAWITHAGRFARCFHNLRGGTLTIPSEVVLDSASPMAATVLQEDGTPAAGATVKQCFSLWDKPLDGADVNSVAMRLFQRMYVSENDGRVDLSAVAGYLCLLASRDDDVSGIWTGEEPAAPTLRLRKTFIASGSVPRHPEPGDTDILDRILITAYVDTWGEEIGYLTVREDGTWGPARLPCRPAREYRFQLDSDVWLPHLIRRPPPGPGENVRLEFPGEKGLGLHVQTVGEDGRGIEGARVSMTCSFADTTLTSQTFTNEHGDAVFRTMRPGSVWVGTHKAGYQPTQDGPFDIYTEPGIPYQVVLSQGGAVQGRVLLGDIPVRTFTVFAWNSDRPWDAERHFQDRTDGSFVIDGLPVGPLSIAVSSLPHARSETITVPVRAGEVSRVEIALSKGLPGVGRVFAAATGRLVPEARVQPMLLVHGRNLGRFGAEQPCESDGSFSIDGFGPDENVCLVSAPGFATARVRGARDSAGVLDFGWIGLQSKGSIDIHVEAEDVEPVERIGAALSPSDAYAERRLDVSGRATFDDLNPDRYLASLMIGPLCTLKTLVDVSAGRSSHWNVERRKVRDLVIEIVPKPGCPVPEGLGCRASYVSPSGREEWYDIALGDQLRCELFLIPADDMIVDVLVPSTIIASRWVHSSREEAQVVRIELDQQPIHGLLLSSSREPIVGANIQFDQPGPGIGWKTAVRTDDQGSFMFGSLPPGSVSAMITSPWAKMWIRDITPSIKPTKRLELVVDCGFRIDLLVLDGDQPLPGLKVDLLSPLGMNFLFDSATTSPEGRCRFLSLSAQEFDAHVSEPGYWPSSLVLASTSGYSVARFQVRRLGGVRLRASIVGTPLRHKAIGLRSIEFDTDVADWIAAGRVQASSAKLFTDEDGRLAVDGLPNGPYRWTAKNSSGETVTGDFVVPPRAVADVNIPLP